MASFMSCFITLGKCACDVLIGRISIGSIGKIGFSDVILDHVR